MDLVEAFIRLYCNIAVVQDSVRNIVLQYYQDILRVYQATGRIIKKPLPVSLDNSMANMLLLKCNMAVNMLCLKQMHDQKVPLHLLEALQQRLTILNQCVTVKQIQQEYEKRCKANDSLFAMEIIVFFGQFVNPHKAHNKILISAAYAGHVNIVQMYVRFLGIDSTTLVQVKKIAEVTCNQQLLAVL